jgi:hypothetical protein
MDECNGLGKGKTRWDGEEVLTGVIELTGEALHEKDCAIEGKVDAGSGPLCG